MFLGREQRIAAGKNHIQGGIGQGFVLEQDNRASLAQVNDLGLARRVHGGVANGALRRGGLPFGVEDARQVRRFIVFGGQYRRAQAVKHKVLVNERLQRIIGYGADLLDIAFFGAFAAAQKVEVAFLGSQAGQGFLAAEKLILKVELGPGEAFSRKAFGGKAAQVGADGVPEFLQLVGLEHDVEIHETGAFHGIQTGVDLIHQAQVVFIFAVKVGGGVAAQKLGQDLQAGFVGRVYAGYGKGEGQVNLFEVFGLGGDYGLLAYFVQVHSRNIALHLAGLDVAKQVLSFLHGLGAVHIAANHQQHVVGLVMGINIMAQIGAFKRTHRVLKADDGPAVAGVFKGLGLNGPEQFASRIIPAALDFLHNNFHFRLHVRRFKGGGKGHVLEHLEAFAPAPVRQVREVAGVVKSGVGIEVAAQRFDGFRDSGFGVALRALKNHVLQGVADAGYFTGFVAGTGMDIQA